jgi:hypothetical protein
MRNERERALRRANYICEDCKQGRAAIAHHVQHDVDGGSDDAVNLLALCTDCHRLRHQGDISERERGGLRTTSL